MTARSTKPESIARSAKRRDTTPKVRKTKSHATLAEARSLGKDTSNLRGISEADMDELIAPDKPLTEKQKLFVKYWAEGDSIPSASLRAGYSDKAQMAYRLVKFPNVLALKAQYELEWQQARNISRQTVIDGMLEAIDMAKMLAEPSSMIAGWREIGKICGFYAPVEHRVKMDVTGNVIVDRLNSLSDAELLKIIQGGATQALPAS